MVAHDCHAGKARICAGAHSRHGIGGMAQDRKSCPAAEALRPPLAQRAGAGNERVDALSALDREHMAAVDDDAVVMGTSTQARVAASHVNPAQQSETLRHHPAAGTQAHLFLSQLSPPQQSVPTLQSAPVGLQQFVWKGGLPS